MIIIYLNNVQVDARWIHNIPKADRSHIGRWSQYDGYYFNGIINDVRFYDGVLDVNRLSGIYNLTKEFYL